MARGSGMQDEIVGGRIVGERVLSISNNKYRLSFGPSPFGST
jgi:hypothetical protein